MKNIHYKWILLNVLLIVSIPLLSQDKEVKEDKKVSFYINHGPYVQAITDNMATIIWTTNEDATSWVEIAPDDDSNFYAEERQKFFETKFGKKVIGKLHRITVSGLTPATSYRYRIFSKNVKREEAYYVEYGRTVSSKVFRAKQYKFKTLDKSMNSISFSVLNDIHSNNELLKKLIDKSRPFNPDFYVLNGDMTSYMSSEEQLLGGFVDTCVKEFATEKPFYMVRGNHETRGTFSDKYIDYFPTTTNNPYYSFKQGPCYFVVLDGGEDKPDSDIEYSGLADFDHYRNSELEWLKTIVNSRDFIQARYRIVFLHVPPTKSSWHGALDLKKKFIPVLNDANIDVMLCAHFHKYDYNPKGENGLNFPMIINSNKEALNIKANDNELCIKIIDVKGDVIKQFNYKPLK